MPTTTDLVIRGRNGSRVNIPEDRCLPDNDQWTNRFQIKSESSNSLYTVAQNKLKRFWGCSCPGWVCHQNCKHLQNLELPSYKQPYEALLPTGSR